MNERNVEGAVKSHFFGLLEDTRFPLVPVHGVNTTQRPRMPVKRPSWCLSWSNEARIDVHACV